MKDTYFTISKRSQGFYKERGSKFNAFVYPVESDLQVKEVVDSLKKEFHDARHHCFAFVLGNEGEHYRANDDGEPNHSAGDPILGQIRSRELTNVLVVVVRYFGGTKLGIPGLINAYKTAASDALDNCDIIEKLITESISIQFDYSEINSVMRIIKEFNLEIVHQDMSMSCEMKLGVRLKLAESVGERLKLLPNVNLLNKKKEH